MLKLWNFKHYILTGSWEIGDFLRSKLSTWRDFLTTNTGGNSRRSLSLDVLGSESQDFVPEWGEGHCAGLVLLKILTYTNTAAVLPEGKYCLFQEMIGAVPFLSPSWFEETYREIISSSVSGHRIKSSGSKDNVKLFNRLCSFFQTYQGAVSGLPEHFGLFQNLSGCFTTKKETPEALYVDFFNATLKPNYCFDLSLVPPGGTGHAVFVAREEEKIFFWDSNGLFLESNSIENFVSTFKRVREATFGEQKEE